MGCELGEGPNWLEPHGERAFFLSPRCPLFPKSMVLYFPHIHCLFMSIPFSLAKQVEKLRQADIWTENSILGCRFFCT